MHAAAGAIAAQRQAPTLGLQHKVQAPLKLASICVTQRPTALVLSPRSLADGVAMVA